MNSLLLTKWLDTSLAIFLNYSIYFLDRNYFIKSNGTTNIIIPTSNMVSFKEIPFSNAADIPTSNLLSFRCESDSINDPIPILSSKCSPYDKFKLLINILVKSFEIFLDNFSAKVYL